MVVNPSTWVCFIWLSVSPDLTTLKLSMRKQIAVLKQHVYCPLATAAPGLTRCQSHFLPAAYLHYDRGFHHINKPMSVVAMYWVQAARRTLNRDHQTARMGHG